MTDETVTPILRRLSRSAGMIVLFFVPSPSPPLISS